MSFSKPHPTGCDCSPVQPAGDVIMSGSPDGSMVAVSSPGKPLRVMNPAGDTGDLEKQSTFRHHFPRL